MATVVPAQVPWDCACTNTQYITSATNPYIGSVTITFNGGYPSTQECQVTTVGASTYCTVSGTIHLNYAPNGFTLSRAQYGDPVTTFTPNLGYQAIPRAPIVLCNGLTLGINLSITGWVGQSQTGLLASCRWACSQI